MISLEPLLDEVEISRLFGRAVPTLQKYRLQGDGPSSASGRLHAGLGSPGSITSGSVIGGSGTSPGSSSGGGAGSGTGMSGGSGGTLPGGTPGSGAGGLGTCCAWLSSNFSKARILSLHAAHGSVVAFEDDESRKRLLAQRVPKKTPRCLEPGKPAAQWLGLRSVACDRYNKVTAGKEKPRSAPVRVRPQQKELRLAHCVGAHDDPR
jgi:hypothetical protein